jgi:hypothetical protein
MLLQPPRTSQAISRVLYAGYELRTESSQLHVKFDNAKVRVPKYGARRSLVQDFGSIYQMFIHEAWVGGPELCVLDVDWYINVGYSAVSGNALVRRPLPPRADTADRYYKLVKQLDCRDGTQTFALQALPHRQLIPVTSRNVAPRSARAHGCRGSTARLL